MGLVLGIAGAVSSVVGLILFARGIGSFNKEGSRWALGILGCLLLASGVIFWLVGLRLS